MNLRAKRKHKAKNRASIRNLKYMRQFAVEYPDSPFVQVPLAQITWYHHISMFPKVKNNILRAFYITESALQGWSRDIMLMQIDDDYHKKVKSLPNNFEDTLPPIKSDLAKAAFKDPYNFGFVDMTKIKQESDLENQLTTKITEFLLVGMYHRLLDLSICSIWSFLFLRDA